MKSTLTLTVTIKQAFVTALIAMVISAVSFGILEPALGHAQTDEFLVTQTITSEISFVASTSDVVMTPNLQSLTGGTSLGTTTVVIRTNDNDGYNLTIHFSSTTAMARNGGGGVINNYVATATPDFAYNTGQVFGQLAYRVTGAQAADVDPTFRDNGAACGTGGGNTYGACWMGPETAGNAEMIINRASSTPGGGSTTTLNFRVTIPANPNPTIPDGVYVATSTLTAVTN
ncbi:hypothetical protein K2P47_04430 [Patescibacteria group bacterium]|nr:hypothetical protein [Patescibacteria group bacterium]